MAAGSTILFASIPGRQKEISDARPAEAILKEVCKKAKASKKNIFVMFGASWCGGCKDFWDELHSSPIWDTVSRNYEVIQLNVYEREKTAKLENKGAVELLLRWADGPPQGIPYYVVLDPSLKFLTDCQSSKAEGKINRIGLFGQTADHFFSVLVKTAPHLKKAELEKLKKWVFDPRRPGG